MSAREDLYERLMMILIGEGVDVQEIKAKVQMALGKYEITDRCTEVALLQEDRNEFLLNKFLVSKTIAGRTDRTIQFYRNTLKYVLDHIGKTIDDIEPDDLLLYFATRQTRDQVAKTTIGNEQRCLSSFFNFLRNNELVLKNPMTNIEMIRPKRRRDEVAFTDEEVERIRMATKNNRELAIIEVMLSTGCRVMELVLMQIDEIKNDQIIVHGKGEKDRICYLNAKARLALEKYLQERKDNNPYVFPGAIYKGMTMVEYARQKGSPYARYRGEWYKHPEVVGDSYIDRGSIETLCRRIGKRANVENVHPHRFRRTCATHALMRGMPLEKVSMMLGHEQLDTTKVYINISQEEMEQAHKKYVV